MTPSHPIRVGIVGAGFIGGLHADAIAALDGVELVAACRTNAEALAAFCRRYGCEAVTDYRKLVRRPDVDVVVVATPHHLHTDVALAAVNEGKALMLEKPMATTLCECDAIVRAASEVGVIGTVGFVNRFAPAYQKARDILATGELGEVVSGVSTMAKYWMEPNRRPWHLDRGTGGGMWLTAGIHCLDRLTWLVDSPIRTVSAHFDTRFHDQRADDAGTVFVRYENGCAGTVVSTGYAVGAPKHLTELTCTKGALTIDYAGGVTIGRNERWERVEDSGSESWMPEAFHEQWVSFLKALRGHGGPAVTLEYGRHVMHAAFAALESSRVEREIVLGAGMVA